MIRRMPFRPKSFPHETLLSAALLTFFACGETGGAADASTLPSADSGGASGADAAPASSDAAAPAGPDAGAQAGPDAGAAGSPIPADRVTAWNPGFLADTQLNQPLGDDGLPQRTTVCSTINPGGNIQAAIDACPVGQVVKLAAGTFTVSSTVTLTKGVVLRGSGSGGAPGGTTIVKSGGSVLAIGTTKDQICRGGTAYALTKDGLKGDSTLSVGANAGKFSPGDLALVDAVDDSAIDQGDCPYFKRVSGRSATQRVEIKSVDAGLGTVTLTSPLHWTFKASAPALAQITRFTSPVVRWAGIESLRVQGGSRGSYLGESAGGIDVSNAAYSWIKDVQTDDTIQGMHVALTGTYRVVVRDSYLHHSADYGFGKDCYGIVLRCGAADGLVENNIVRYMNKPILFNVSGGGNVVAYNYADNAYATPATWQEVPVDCHCAFPHMELMEGNWAPHMGATTTHGNAGYLTYFRNYASSQFASPPVWGSTAEQTGNVTCLQFDAGDLGMNVVGNVLGTDGVTKAYDAHAGEEFSVYKLGGASDVSATSLFRDGNYDFFHKSAVWQAGFKPLPASLYLSQKPKWWPTGQPWPWTGPDVTPLVGTLPAKARSDAMP